MMIVVRIVVLLVGVVGVVSTLGSAIKTVVVPRAILSRLSRFHFVLIRRLFELFASHKRAFAARDRVMALYAPVALVALPGTWVVIIIAGFTCIFWGSGVDTWADAFVTSGSSLLTLGFNRPDGVGLVGLTFVEAGLGLGLVSLMISYLPTIYGAFSRREVLVGMLEVRAGSPPSPVELLTRYAGIGWLASIDDDLFETWEPWFADVEESHTSQPSLVFFRSPRPERHWLTAAGCVLDSAALVASSVEREQTGVPDLLIRSGYLALRRIADFFQIEFDADPAPTDPISITRAEFDRVWGELIAANVPLRPDRDQAWSDFSGWRVNYDQVLVGLCALTMAPPAPWSSDLVRGDRQMLRMRRSVSRR
jgi:hypothetical protein